MSEVTKARSTPPPDPLAPPPGPETVGPFLIAKLRTLQACLEAAKPRVLASADQDAVHDLRVALRRGRIVLAVGRSVFGGFHADQVRRALGAVHRATGALRDEEVLVELLASLSVGDERAEVETWIRVRRRRERNLRARVRRLMGASALDRGLTLLDALLVFDVKPTRDKRLAKFARRAIDAARREVDRLRAAPESDAQALHRLRIGYKRLRYTVETFADAPGASLAAPLAQSASRFQSLLGRIHDADVAEGAVQRARGLSEGAREALLRELSAFRAVRLHAYDKARGASPESKPLAHVYASGTDSLRKTSTR